MTPTSHAAPPHRLSRRAAPDKAATVSDRRPLRRSRPQKVLIIGAGATGLVAAYLLTQAGVEVEVVEAAPRPGGLLATFEIEPGMRLEYFYHHFFTHDAELHWLLAQLGLQDAIRFVPATMDMFRNGRVYPFNGPKDLLRFDALSLPARLRFGLSSALLIHGHRWLPQPDIGALTWFRRWAGRAATEAIWRPMMEIKFGDAAEQIPLAWMVGRLRQRALSRRRGEEFLGYLHGSLQSVVDRLVAELTQRGVKLHLRTPTTRFTVADGRVTGVETPQGRFSADRVVSTVPTPLLAEWIAPVDAAFAQQLDSIEYFGALCTVLALREPLSQTYWTNVADPGYDFGGVIEHTNLIPAAEYGGRHLVYLSRYLSSDHPLWSLDDRALLERQIAQLGRLTGRDVAGLLDQSWIFRGRYAAPLNDRGFEQRIPAFRAPCENLYLASMCHLYPDERSINNSVRLAAEVVREMGFADAADLVPRGQSQAATWGAVGAEQHC